MGTVLQPIDALADVLGIVQFRPRQLDFRLPTLGFEHDVICDGEFVGYAQILRLEHNSVDQDEIGVVHRIDKVRQVTSPSAERVRVPATGT